MSDLGTAVRKLSVEDVETWSQVGEGEIFVSDAIDQPRAPGADREAKLQAGHRV